MGDLLKTQLLTFKASFKELNLEKVTLKDIVDFMKKPGCSNYLSEIAKVLKLNLVLPATNAQDERVFSTLSCVKTKVRNSIGQPRLNHLMMLTEHKVEAKKLSLSAVANDFAIRNERRKQDFGINKF